MMQSDGKNGLNRKVWCEMARYIDAYALTDVVWKSRDENPHSEGRARIAHFNEHSRFLAMIDRAPTIEARPVVRGEWLLRHEGRGHYWECSVCHTNPCIYVTKDTNFCPNCGADMRGEEDG